MAYGVRKKKGLSMNANLVSCLYGSDLRKIDAQIRCTSLVLGIFSRPGEKEDSWEEKKIKRDQMKSR